jgi:hypothetical protein
MTEENYWVIIPPPIVGDKKLPSGAKLVFGRINALVTRKGYCYASNEFLGKHLDLTKKTVSNYVSLLAYRGHLRVELIRDERNRVKERRIYTHLSNYKGIPIHNPIQLYMDNSNDRVKSKSINTKAPPVIKGLSSVNDILKKIKPSYLEKKNSGVSDWQEMAVRYAEKLGLKKNEMDKQWFKCFRDNSKGLLARSYSYVYDYNGAKDIKKLFYWSLSQFKKYGEIRQNE